MVDTFTLISTALLLINTTIPLVLKILQKIKRSSCETPCGRIDVDMRSSSDASVSETSADEMEISD